VAAKTKLDETEAEANTRLAINSFLEWDTFTDDLNNCN